MGLFEHYGRPMEEVTAEFGRPWEGEPETETVEEDLQISGIQTFNVGISNMSLCPLAG